MFTCKLMWQSYQSNNTYSKLQRGDIYEIKLILFV